MKKKGPACILAGDSASIVLQARLEKRKNGDCEVVLDVKNETGVVLATGIKLTETHKLEGFITEVYDYRREQLYGIRRW